MTSGEVARPAPVPAPRARRPSLEEQAQERGTQPIGDGEFYAREELFAEPGELEDFLDFLYESRRAGIA
jgi:hypothetical protein